MKALKIAIAGTLVAFSVYTQPAEAGVLRKLFIVAKAPFRLVKNVAIGTACGVFAGGAVTYFQTAMDLDRDKAK